MNTKTLYNKTQVTFTVGDGEGVEFKPGTTRKLDSGVADRLIKMYPGELVDARSLSGDDPEPSDGDTQIQRNPVTGQAIVDQEDIDDQITDEGYNGYTVPELNKMIEDRKTAGREIELPEKPKKADLVSALEADDDAAQSEQ